MKTHTATYEPETQMQYPCKSGTRCSAKGCENSRRNFPKLSFYRFPKDKDRCKQWILNCRRPELLDKPIERLCAIYHVCELHFKPSQFMDANLKNRLNWNAIPTVFGKPVLKAHSNLLDHIETTMNTDEESGGGGDHDYVTVNEENEQNSTGARGKQAGTSQRGASGIEGQENSPLQKYMLLCSDLKSELRSARNQMEILENLKKTTFDSVRKQAEALPVDSLVDLTGSLLRMLQTKHKISFQGADDAALKTIWRKISQAESKPAPKRPGVGVAVFVLGENHPEQILLGRRKNTVGSGLYQVPGGHIEFGETWEQAAYREVLEETGLHIHNISVCSIVDTVNKEFDYHYVTIFMRGFIDESRGTEPKNMEPEKNEGWHWWKWATLPTPDLLFWCLKDFKLKNLNPF